MTRFGWIAVWIFMLAIGSMNGASAVERVALVIGNSAYADVPRLANPKRDASAIAASLRRLGFDKVILKTDQDYTSLRRTLRSFSRDVAEMALPR